MWNLKIKERNKYNKTETDTGNKPVVTRREGAERGVKEAKRIKSYKLLGIKQISYKNVQYREYT